jgi:hypothetical protein
LRRHILVTGGRKEARPVAIYVKNTEKLKQKKREVNKGK